MKLIIKISLFLIVILTISCNEDKIESVVVTSEEIDNFSNINYKDSPDHPYFSEIKKLPNGFSLGGFNDYNSILYLTESANIFPFDDENLKFFLTQEELNSAFESYLDSSYTEPKTRKIQYYPYERLVTKNYVLLIINKRKNESNGRDYEFDLRTYTFDGELISKLTMAKWDDDNDTYFSGWLMPDMTVKRTFDNKNMEYFVVTENGEIKEKDANTAYGK